MDLSKYEVAEMNESEKKQVEGGFWSALRIATGHYLFYFALQVAIDPQSHIDAFKEGWESAGK